MASSTPAGPGVERRRLAVSGADAVLVDLAARLAAGTSAGLAAARSLARHRVDWTAIRADVVSSAHAIILAGDELGPVLGARVFDPDRPTAIHDHGCAGAAVVVDGRQRYERFERTSPASARLESVHDLAAGDVVWWGEPPDDVHRQRATGRGAIELVLLCGEVVEPSTFTEADAPGPGGPASDLRRRATDTAAGLLLETETRFTDPTDGRPRASREVHQLRLRDGLVAEHVVWCAGINDPETIHRQFDTAPMERM